MNEQGLNRFLRAHDAYYNDALNEIRNGKKEGHWIWFIFPQLKGLGASSTNAMYYELQDINEAKEYLNNPTLRKDLIEISEALLMSNEYDITKIMHYPDNLKLHSSMTLFSLLEPNCKTFRMVLEKFYDGKLDEATVNLINNS